MKYSIIVPIFNAGQTLALCLDSVKNQNYRDFECILIDDGSHDASPSICEEYAMKDSRFKVLHQENKGVSSARNTGLENAHGD